jgi:hypothetical protein
MTALAARTQAMIFRFEFMVCSCDEVNASWQDAFEPTAVSRM